MRAALRHRFTQQADKQAGSSGFGTWLGRLTGTMDSDDEGTGTSTRWGMGTGRCGPKTWCTAVQPSTWLSWASCLGGLCDACGVRLPALLVSVVTSVITLPATARRPAAAARSRRSPPVLPPHGRVAAAATSAQAACGGSSTTRLAPAPQVGISKIVFNQHLRCHRTSFCSCAENLKTPSIALRSPAGSTTRGRDTSSVAASNDEEASKPKRRGIGAALFAALSFPRRRKRVVARPTTSPAKAPTAAASALEPGSCCCTTAHGTDCISFESWPVVQMHLVHSSTPVSGLHFAVSCCGSSQLRLCLLGFVSVLHSSAVRTAVAKWQHQRESDGGAGPRCRHLVPRLWQAFQSGGEDQGPGGRVAHDQTRLCSATGTAASNAVCAARPSCWVPWHVQPAPF